MIKHDNSGKSHLVKPEKKSTIFRASCFKLRLPKPHGLD